ncbi:MAG TPA: ABC transporter transmembrane domain-containing protein, partial [Bacillota bacterium]
MNTGKRLMHYVKPYWRQLTVGFVTMVFMSAIQLVYPVIMGPGLIDRVLNTKDFRMLNWLVLLVIVAVSIKACLTFAQNYFMAFVGQRVVANLRNAVFHHLQKMSIAFHESHRVGEIISRVT